MSALLLHCWIAGVLSSWVHHRYLFICPPFSTIGFEEFSTRRFNTVNCSDVPSFPMFSTRGFNSVNCSDIRPSSQLLDSKSCQLVGSTLLLVQMSALLLNCWIAGVLNQLLCSTLFIVQMSALLLHCWIVGVLNSWVQLCYLFRCPPFFSTVEWKEFLSHGFNSVPGSDVRPSFPMFSTRGFNSVSCSNVRPSSPLLNRRSSQLVGSTLLIVQISTLLLHCWIARGINSRGFNSVHCSDVRPSSPLLDSKSCQLVGSTLLLVQMSALLLNCWIAGVLNQKLLCSTLFIVQMPALLLHCWIAGVLNSWVQLC